MEDNRGSKNIIAGLLSQIFTFAIGIVIPRLVLVNLGSEANGLLNSVTSILTYMALLEAGVGTATLQVLYKPCANKDFDSINSILAATDHFYKRTAKVYFLIIVAISIIYSVFVKSSIPTIEVFAVVFLSGCAGVLSYIFQGKFRILLTAEGRTYVVTSITTIIYIATSIAKAILLYCGFSVGVVQVSYFCFSVLQVVLFLLYIKRKYPWINLKVNPDFQAIAQKNAVLVHQITYMVFNNTDVLILTVFASLKEVSVYSMYALIYGMVKSLAISLYEGYTYAIGQAYYTDKERFSRMINAYEVFSILITFSFYCICRALILPFIALYTAGVNDINYIDPYLPWLFSAFYLLHNARTASGTVINISQHFEDTKWRSVIEAVINLIVSILCVIRFGIYGVLFGTIAALLYRTNDMIIYASKILKRSCIITYKRWAVNVITFLAISYFLSQFSWNADNYFTLIGNAIIVGTICLTGFLIVNTIFDFSSVRYVFSAIIRRIRRVVVR